MTLAQTKSHTGPVSIIIRDVSLIALLKSVVRAGSPDRVFCPAKYRDFSLFFLEFAFFLGMPGGRFIGHGLRRGGATHLFRASQSYDLTQRQGRWVCAKTCQAYIDEALVE